MPKTPKTPKAESSKDNPKQEPTESADEETSRGSVLSGESDAPDQQDEEMHESATDDNDEYAKTSILDFKNPSRRGVYYHGFKRPEKPGTVPNMATFRKEMYDSLEGISMVQFKNIRSLDAKMHTMFSEFSNTLASEIQSVKQIMLFQGGSSQMPESSHQEATFQQSRRVQRDDDLLMPGRRQMTEDQALSLDYLDGRRLNFFALNTSLAESIVNRDLLPYHLWLPTIASRFGSQLTGFANSATRYGWNWVQFCAVIAHVRRASGFAQSSPGEMIRQWRLSLNEEEPLLEVVWQFNDLIPALPEQFSGQFIDLIQETFTLISPSFWHHVRRIRTPQPGFSVALWWADIVRCAKMERFAVALWSMTLKQIAPHVVNQPISRSTPQAKQHFPAAEMTTAFPIETDKCHRCGKQGHWARDCRYRFSEKKLASKTRTSKGATFMGQRYPSNKKGKRVYVALDEADDSSEDDKPTEDNHPAGSDDDDDNVLSGDDTAYWVNVGRHSNEVAKPPRDDGQHALYRAYIEQPGTGKTQPVDVFLDNGSISCWISDSLVRSLRLMTYPATSVSTLSGIGEGGHRVTHDALLHLYFASSSGGHTADSPGSTGRVSIACGVIPDGIFPAALTLGREFQHAAWTVANPDKTVTFMSFDVPITLAPLVNGKRCYTTVTAPTFDYLVGFDTALNKDEQFELANEAFTANSGEDLPMVQRFQERFPNLFTPSGKMIARASIITHSIDTGSAAPIRLPPRRYSLPQQSAISEFVQAGLAQGTIRISNSPWSSPIHVVQKPDGRYRPCVDYRAVNNVTRKNAFPLPNIDDQIQIAAGHQFYTTLDLRDGFWQIPMSTESIEKTAFSTPDGHYEFLVMPFGLTNAPATFQEFMNRLLLPVRRFIAGLLDDICIFGNSEQELENRTIQVLKLLNDNGLILQLRKCRWNQSSVRFLGLVIDRNGLHTDPAKVMAITERPLPRTITEVRSFVHAAAYFRRFIQDFSRIVSPLYELTKNSPSPGSKVVLNDEQKTAIERLTRALTTSPTLKKFDFSRRCIIDTDSSATHIGGVLQQPYLSNDKDALYPVSYESHKLTSTQQRYSAQEKELLAVVHCCIKWRHFIEGCDVTIRTDHESLTLLRSKTEQPARVQRFLNQIEHFDLTILYRPGKANRVPDWLSRPTIADEREGVPQTAFPVTAGYDDDIRLKDTNLSDLDLEKINHYLKDKSNGHDLNVRDEAIYQRFQLIDDRLCRVVGHHLVNVESRESTLRKLTEFHATQGHPTVGTLERALRYAVWHPQYHLLAQETVISCSECATRVPVNRLRQQFTPVPRQEPFVVWASDYAGPLTHQGQKYHVLCGIEYVTGLLLCAVTPSPSSQFAKSMLFLVRSCFPALRVLISDNGAAFIDQDFHTFARSLQINRILSPPEYAERNGRVERAIGQLKLHLYRFMSTEKDTAFSVLVDRAKNLYNNSPQLHGFSPSFLTFDIEQWHPQSEELAKKRRELQNHVQVNEEQHPDQEIQDRAVTVFRANLQAHRQEANSAKDQRDRTRKRRFDESALYHHFSPGDWVLRARIRNHKHEPFFDGPWRVISVDTRKNIYVIKSAAGIERANPVHGTKLIPCLTYEGQPVHEPFMHSRQALNEYRRHIDLLKRDQLRY